MKQSAINVFLVVCSFVLVSCGGGGSRSVPMMEEVLVLPEMPVVVEPEPEVEL